MSNTRTFEVQHPESHYPTDEQMTSELRSVLKDDGLKLHGSAEFFLVESTSASHSKVRATFEAEESAAAPATAAKDAAKK